MARPTLDLKDLTGSPFDDMADISDRPDSLRIDEMRQKLIDRINAMPGNSATALNWSEKNRAGISDELLYGPHHELREGLDWDQRQLIYETVAPQFENLSGPQIAALDERDAQAHRTSEAMWSDFHTTYPQWSAEQVEVAAAATIEEMRGYGINPDKALSDWSDFKERLAHTLKFGSAHGYMPELMEERERDLPNDDGRSMGLDYGGAGPRQAPATDTRRNKDPAGSMREELIEEQRKLGLW
jgi:hypothetical protein